MNNLGVTGLIAHSMLPAYKNKLARSVACIEYAFKLCNNPFIAFSGGKDSAVMLHMVLSIKETCHAQILTGGESRLLHANLDQVLGFYRTMFPRAIIREVNIDHVFSTEWESTDFLTMYQSFYDGWSRYMHAPFDYDGFFIGLRAQESNKRRYALRQKIKDCPHPILKFSHKRGDAQAGVYRIAPVADWSTADIAAYITTNRLLVLSGYEDGYHNRTETRINFNAGLHNGQLARLRKRDPDAYYRIIERFPELKEYT